MDKFYKNKKIIILFLLPSILVYILLEVIPIIASIGFSFFTWNGVFGIPLEFVGLSNFEKILDNKEFLLSIKNVFWFVLLSLMTQIPLGLLLAVLLNNLKIGVKQLKAIFFLPVVLSITAVSLMWYFILMPTGALNALLGLLNLENLQRNWLASKDTALNSVILVNAWISAGYYMTIFHAALSTIDDSILESAIIDGSTGMHRLFNISLPMIWNQLTVAIVLVVTGTLKVFEIVYIMTNGGPNGASNVPMSFMFNEIFVYQNYGLGSAASTFIFIMCMLVALLTTRTMKRGAD